MITGIGVGIWHTERRRSATRKGRTEVSSGMSVEMMINYRGIEEQDYHFTPKKVNYLPVVISYS